MGQKNKWFDPKPDHAIEDDLIIFPSPRQLTHVTPAMIDEFLAVLKQRNLPAFVHQCFSDAAKVRPSHRRVLEATRKAVLQLSSISSLTLNDVRLPRTLLDLEYRSLVEIQRAGLEMRLVEVAHVLLCLAERESTARFVLELASRYNKEPKLLLGDGPGDSSDGQTDIKATEHN